MCLVWEKSEHEVIINVYTNTLMKYILGPNIQGILNPCIWIGLASYTAKIIPFLK